MSVLIKGMKMPENCGDCPCMRITDYCEVLETDFDDYDGFDHWKERLPDCPLMEIKSPHGRLFDETEVKKCLQELPDSEDKWGAIALLEWAMQKRWCIEAEDKE